LGKWFPGLTIPGLVAGGAAVATTAAIGATIDKGMKQVNDKEILKITKDVTVAQEREGFDPEQSYVAYKMAIDDALESSHNASPERQDYIKQQLTQAEELSDTERRMAARYFYEKEGRKSTGPTSRGGNRSAVTPKEDSIPAEIMAEGSDTVDTNYANVPVEQAPVEEVVFTASRSAPEPKAAEGGTGSLSASTYESRLKALGDVIAKGESKGDYNIFNKGAGNKYAVGREDLSKMSIAEYLRRGALPSKDPERMFAVGKYQIIPDTMKQAVAKLGIPTSTTLAPETQEHIFREFLTKAKRPAIHAYLSGKSDNIKAAQIAMAQEWASVGVPEAMQGANRWVQKGESYYAGDGINKAHTSPEAVMSAVTPTPVMPAATADRESRALQASTTGTQSVTVVGAPTNVQNTQVNNTMGKRPVQKASVLAQDKTLNRTLGRDVQHPVYG
jgi:hypothetical protein